MSIKSIALIGVLGITLAGCKPDPVDPTPTTNEFHFKFDNYFGDNELELNTGNYTTANSEEITVSAFNYWITNIVLVGADGNDYTEPESYRLMRGDQGSSRHFHMLDVPAGTYTGVKFTIGVDVARNTSGAQDGALDPATNGDMYWSWNTGYIQSKLEGTSPQSTETGNKYEYHIGGVKAGQETPQEVTLSFGNNVVVGEQAGSVIVKTDLAKWFPTPMPIAMMAIMTHPNEMAHNIAKGYVDMFSIMSATNE